MRPLYGRDPRDRSTYALLAHDARAVKVGSSEFVEKRIRTIVKNSPVSLVLIGCIDEYIERELHAKLWEHRIHGEWFTASSRVLDAIACAMPRINVPVDTADRFGRRRAS